MAKSKFDEIFNELFEKKAEKIRTALVYDLSDTKKGLEAGRINPREAAEKIAYSFEKRASQFELNYQDNKDLEEDLVEAFPEKKEEKK